MRFEPRRKYKALDLAAGILYIMAYVELIGMIVAGIFTFESNPLAAIGLIVGAIVTCILLQGVVSLIELLIDLAGDQQRTAEAAKSLVEWFEKANPPPQ